MSNFERKLEQGKIGESEIAEWLKRRGYHILPIYEIEKGQYAGPSVYISKGDSIVAPDMLVFGGKKRIAWVEAKNKAAFTKHRITNRFVTGIDLHHYHHYLQIQDLVDWPIWLFFLQRGGTAVDSPESEAGLFGESLKNLKDKVNHEWPYPLPGQKHGMVYWAKESLIKLDEYPFEM